MKCRLHVNIDHVATLRQARGTTYPDPIWAASICEMAGAQGITAHLREDRRHMQDRDLQLLRQTVRTKLNLEMAVAPQIVEFALRLKPDMVTLVPERREERTTEGGLDPRTPSLAEAMKKLRGANIPVSLFINAKPELMQAAADLGAQMVELHTGEYCHATGAQVEEELRNLRLSAQQAEKAKLKVAAGHGLDYPNVEAVAAIEQIEELNIGHSIIARAVFVGMDRAVRDMLSLINP